VAPIAALALIGAAPLWLSACSSDDIIIPPSVYDAGVDATLPTDSGARIDAAGSSPPTDAGAIDASSG
jgi:hypothetical protein